MEKKKENCRKEWQKEPLEQRKPEVKESKELREDSKKRESTRKLNLSLSRSCSVCMFMCVGIMNPITLCTNLKKTNRKQSFWQIFHSINTIPTKLYTVCQYLPE